MWIVGFSSLRNFVDFVGEGENIVSRAFHFKMCTEKNSLDQAFSSNTLEGSQI